MEISREEFISNVKNVKGPRNYKVHNSLGVYDAYKYYRKNRPKDKKFVLTESQYFAIIRRINLQLADLLIKGEDLIFPQKLGKLELRKQPLVVKLDNGTIKTNAPIDWNATLKLWYEDKESYDNKKLVRRTSKEFFSVNYNKSNANYNNKSYYQFTVNRDIKLGLKQAIKENKIDAFLEKKYGTH